MKCCYATPRLKLPSHRLLPGQATAPRLRPLTTPSFLNPRSGPSPNVCLAAAAAAARRAVSSSSSTKALFHRPTNTAAARSPATEEEHCEDFSSSSTCACSDGYSRRVAVAAATLGIAAAVFMTGVDGKEALALGPEGPLVEEFWDNMRRYGLYMLTVSTGAIYTILQPVLELLKNPISAILLLIILGGSVYLLSQVLSFMVGINEFSYDYAS